MQQQGEEPVDVIQPGLQGLQHLPGRDIVAGPPDFADGRLHFMSHGAQPHGASQACTALEGVEQPQGFLACAFIARPCRPLPHDGVQLRNQCLCFFTENGEQFGI